MASFFEKELNKTSSKKYLHTGSGNIVTENYTFKCSILASNTFLMDFN